jgi:hypothetical protein
MAIPRPRMHLRYAQPRIPVYLSRGKDIKDAFKVCPTPDPCLVVEGQRHMRFPGVPRTKSSILLTIRIHQIRWRVTGLPTTFNDNHALYYNTLCISSNWLASDDLFARINIIISGYYPIILLQKTYITLHNT